MARLSPIEHRTIVVVDVADFANPQRGVADLVAVQNGVYDVLKTAFFEAGVDFETCDVEDRGDGALILVPPDVSKRKLAELLPERLTEALDRHNATRTSSTRFRLRVGIHAGEVAPATNGWVGHALNLTMRIIDGPEVKSALTQSDGLVALAASDDFYSEVIEQDPAVLPTLYRRIPVTAKNFAGVVWLRLLGEGASMPALAATSPDDDVLGVVPPGEIDTVRSWLSEIEAPVRVIHAAQTVGPAIPPRLRTSAWGVFRYLAGFDATSDGEPPALEFLRLLAGEIGGEFQTEVSAWVDRQTERLWLTPAADELRASNQPVPEEAKLHLMIVVEPDVVDPDRCVVSSWRQDDPGSWPPHRADERDVALDELEYRVDDIVSAAERAWPGQATSAVIEFVLPRHLLTLPVQRWRKEHRSGEPRPLALDYELRIRSLERMCTTYWHRSWKLR